MVNLDTGVIKAESEQETGDLEKKVETRHFEAALSPIPSEEIVFFEVAVGCPYSGPGSKNCTFCGLQRDKKYRPKKVDEAKQHIDDMVQAYGDRIRQERRTVFIGDGDALALGDPLKEILRYINTLFNFNGASDPRLDAKGVEMYGDAYTASTKSPEFYKELKQLNVTGIHNGFESGSDQLLAAVNKRSSAAYIREAVERITSAGIKVYGSVIVGLGESKYEGEHVNATVGLVAEMSPEARSGLVIALSNLSEPYKDYVAQRERGEFGRQLTPLEIQNQRRQFERQLSPLVGKSNVIGYVPHRRINYAREP